MLFRIQTIVATLAVSTATVDASGIRARRTEDAAIVGGMDVPDSTFGWMALFGNPSGGNTCGGALVGIPGTHQNKVVTTASCIETLFGSFAAANEQFLAVGGWDSSNVGEALQIQCVTPHPSYSSAGSVNLNDIAMVTTFGNSINIPIAGNGQTDYPSMPSGGATANLAMLGFGANTVGGSPSTQLRNISMPHVDVTTCSGLASYSGQLTPGQHLCAGGNIGEGPCTGDGGSPLLGINIPLVAPNQVFTLVGLYQSTGLKSATGLDCGQSTTPALYTDIATFAGWIQEQLDSTCPATPSPTPIPTPSPTPFPTPVPTSAPAAAPAPMTCFSESATVQVLDSEEEGPRSVAMKDLQVGQKIFAGYDQEENKPIYEDVYGFAHRDVDRVGEYLRIKTGKRAALEISSSHLIFVEGQKDPVRADSLSVGDVLIQQAIDQKETQHATITDIQYIYQRGLYAPLTKDGTVIVDGIRASSYVSISHHTPRMVDTVVQVMSEQTIFHLWMSPYRLFCTRVAPELCMNDYSQVDGYIHWLVLGKSVAEAGDDYNTLIRSIGLALMVSFCAVFVFMEKVLESPLFWLVQLVCACYLWMRFSFVHKQVALLKKKMHKKVD